MYVSLHDDCFSNTRILRSFFEANPEYQKLFPTFANTPVKVLLEDKMLLGHAVRILEAFATRVNENLHSKEKLEQAYYDTGKSHISKTVGPTHVKVSPIV